MRLLLQTPPSEAHWLGALARRSLIGCELALLSAAQPGRRGGRHDVYYQVGVASLFPLTCASFSHLCSQS